MSRKAVILLLGAALALAPAANAYVIYLKDGTRLTARDKPEQKGDKLLFYTEIGVLQQVDLAELDVERTDKANAAGMGNAYVLENPDATTNSVVNFGNKRSLQDHIKKNKVNLDAFAEPTPDPSAPYARPPREKSPLEKGLNDPTGPSLDPLVNDAFLRALEASGIRGPQLAPISRGVRVSATTDSEAQVFAALGAVARAIKESRAKNLVVDRAEVRLSTASGEPAGSFEMSPDDADSLLNGRVAVSKYFVANVQF